MKDTEYYKSGRQLENVMKARKLALLGSIKTKQKRVDDYNRSPKVCKECDNSLPYKDKHKKFCNSKCSAIYTNKMRKETGYYNSEIHLRGNEKKSVTMFGRQLPLIHRGKRLKHDPVELICKICKKVSTVEFKKRHLKTCGADDCKIQASVGVRMYQNGSRKPVYYFNKNENKEVLLESSWEVELAKWLDNTNIKWIRPKFIKWYDSTGKTRRYFPDFFLPEYNLYLDPKNPYCMSKDKEKMQCISSVVDIIYGDIKEVIQGVGQRLTTSFGN